MNSESSILKKSDEGNPSSSDYQDNKEIAAMYKCMVDTILKNVEYLKKFESILHAELQKINHFIEKIRNQKLNSIETVLSCVHYCFSKMCSFVIHPKVINELNNQQDLEFLLELIEIEQDVISQMAKVSDEKNKQNIMASFNKIKSDNCNDNIAINALSDKQTKVDESDGKNPVNNENLIRIIQNLSKDIIGEPILLCLKCIEKTDFYELVKLAMRLNQRIKNNDSKTEENNRRIEAIKYNATFLIKKLIKRAEGSKEQPEGGEKVDVKMHKDVIEFEEGKLRQHLQDNIILKIQTFYIALQYGLNPDELYKEKIVPRLAEIIIKNECVADTDNIIEIIYLVIFDMSKERFDECKFKFTNAKLNIEVCSNEMNRLTEELMIFRKEMAGGKASNKKKKDVQKTAVNELYFEKKQDIVTKTENIIALCIDNRIHPWMIKGFDQQIYIEIINTAMSNKYNEIFEVFSENFMVRIQLLSHANNLINDITEKQKKENKQGTKKLSETINHDEADKMIGLNKESDDGNSYRNRMKPWIVLDLALLSNPCEIDIDDLESIFEECMEQFFESFMEDISNKNSEKGCDFVYYIITGVTQVLMQSCVNNFVISKEMHKKLIIRYIKNGYKPLHELCLYYILYDIYGLEQDDVFMQNYSSGFYYMIYRKHASISQAIATLVLNYIEQYPIEKVMIDENQVMDILFKDPKELNNAEESEKTDDLWHERIGMIIDANNKIVEKEKARKKAQQENKDAENAKRGGAQQVEAKNKQKQKKKKKKTENKNKVLQVVQVVQPVQQARLAQSIREDSFKEILNRCEYALYNMYKILNNSDHDELKNHKADIKEVMDTLKTFNTSLSKGLSVIDALMKLFRSIDVRRDVQQNKLDGMVDKWNIINKIQTINGEISVVEECMKCNGVLKDSLANINQKLGEKVYNMEKNTRKIDEYSNEYLDELLSMIYEMMNEIEDIKGEYKEEYNQLTILCKDIKNKIWMYLVERIRMITILNVFNLIADGIDKSANDILKHNKYVKGSKYKNKSISDQSKPVNEMLNGMTPDELKRIMCTVAQDICKNLVYINYQLSLEEAIEALPHLGEIINNSESNALNSGALKKISMMILIVFMVLSAHSDTIIQKMKDISRPMPAIPANRQMM